ncbi:DUF6382 domain-containing protein [Paenibacillus sediminis]|uniref:FHA domain-containing protein n=1 Tax=Paenibacillus sediminis TaxID=664909 RepID=A0ABS4H4H9_9BACL|nr:DUF6382 domain-containing protein [Paenibacillus sediminis]MBP1937439.1 hypothetical protein [Paenibacillus sediminis]
MVSFHTDFIQNGGTYMVLQHPEGIHTKELSQVQCGMIASTKIPHLLHLNIKELDFKVTFQYDITAKRMLSHCLKSEKMNMTEFYTLLLQLVSALEDSKLYMLDHHNYILHEDYMFIDGSLQLGTLYLTYVPLQKPMSNEIQESLNRLISLFMTSVSHLEGNGLQQIVQFCRNDFFTIQGLKSLLIQLLAGNDNEEAATPKFKIELQMQEEVAEERSVVRSIDRSINRPLDRHADHSVDRSMPHPFFSISTAASSAKIESNAEHSEAEEDNPKSSSSMKTYVTLGCVVGSVLPWRLVYLEAPSTGTMFMCAAITVLLGITAVLYWIGKLSFLRNFGGQSIKQVPVFESIDLGSAMSSSKGKSRFAVEKLTGFIDSKRKSNTNKELWCLNASEAKEEIRTDDYNLAEHSIQKLQKPQTKQKQQIHTDVEAIREFKDRKNTEDYYAELSSRTEMLSSPRGQATVMLKPNSSKGSARQTTALFLERLAQGMNELERIELHHASFIIGRSSDVAQYVDETVGTSRAHVELMIVQDGCRIKDLGSKNGTVLRGEPMVPYKDYPLQEGDTFNIAGTSYKLCSD